ncbi:hypothetical protein A3715_10345 [Oleiphilus sp. HI0009]|nr:hypothetical protein A3715_10345 [Oleiphilus sp. HI0009]
MNLNGWTIEDNSYDSFGFTKWIAIHDEHDGAPDGESRCISGNTLKEIVGEMAEDAYERGDADAGEDLERISSALSEDASLTELYTIAA